MENIDFNTIIKLLMILVFSYSIFRFLLTEKAIKNENTMRFSALLVSLTIVLIVAVFPLKSDVATGLIGLAGTIIGYFIRDAVGARKLKRSNEPDA